MRLRTHTLFPHALAGKTFTATASAESFRGGLGIDTVAYNRAPAAISADLTRKAGRGWAAGDSFVSIENLVGSRFNDSLSGNGANNRLDGGRGADVMTGRGGNDRYHVDNAGDRVIEAAGGGTDEVLATISHTLAANVENLTLAGTAAISGTGNGLANAITGNGAANTLKGLDGDDTLDGGAGADTLIGGNGNDDYWIDASDKLIELANGGNDTVHAGFSHDLADYFENLILTGSDNINGGGNAANNRITGNSGRNALSGGDGDDVLDGGAGTDFLQGGNGSDIYIVDDAGDRVNELSGNSGDWDIIRAGVSFTIVAGVEEIQLTGGGDLNATGDDNANRLTGNDGKNILDGKAGADLMAGGKGDDIYVVDTARDEVSELAGQGDDTVRTGLAGYTLPDNVENLELTAAVGGHGNGLANHIWLTVLSGMGAGLDGGAGDDRIEGSNGDDTLDGGTGADRLEGKNGNDTYFVDNAADVILEALASGRDSVRASVDWQLGDNLEDLWLEGGAVNGTGNALANSLTGNEANNRLSGAAGNDTLSGLGGDDTLQGGEGDDTLKGGGGNDWLDGGTGADSMTGGAGDDRYSVDDADDSLTEATDQGTDTVEASCDFTLPDNCERLVLTGAGLTGWGGSGDDVLIARAGGTLYGADGNDVFGWQAESLTIGDFATGDRINFHGAFSDYDAMIAAGMIISDEADGLHLSLGGKLLVRLADFHGELAQADFDFSLI